jgi:hypothetical protein
MGESWFWGVNDAQKLLAWTVGVSEYSAEQLMTIYFG